MWQIVKFRASVLRAKRVYETPPELARNDRFRERSLGGKLSGICDLSGINLRYLTVPKMRPIYYSRSYLRLT